ncbi:c-type cytochrome [Parahaliea mediterranea]|uniref:Cytochrome C n=1 Tax=Parahaliea mediterranea TaxID=651086 RepID=A0A939DJW8_9GAMM|nr:c-type cytochrome [Parahaliea mediterranea]MBN7798847.1 cytochrome C [Parahaliea mediterranea]
MKTRQATFPRQSSSNRLSLVAKVLASSVVAVLAACATGSTPGGIDEVTPATTFGTPNPDTSRLAPDRAAAAARGQYLVELLGCGTCHTDGALVGQPNAGRRLAGSSVGIAWSNPLQEDYPGVVFPANLTPDTETGIGGWREDDIVTFLRSGIDRAGRGHLPVMPWPAYARLSDDDASAVATYLLSLPPVRHRVPANVDPGQRTSAGYVHFGIYRKR